MEHDARSDAPSDTSPSPASAGPSSSPSRRAFLRTASASAVLAALGIPLTGCGDDNPVGPEEEPPGEGEEEEDSGITIDGSTITLDLTKDDTDHLQEEGRFLLIREADVLAVNVDGEQIRAFTSTCTHQQCTINQFDGSTFQCPCHGSEFDTSGDVVEGPATQSLTEYDVERDGDVVTITK